MLPFSVLPNMWVALPLQSRNADPLELKLQHSSCCGFRRWFIHSNNHTILFSLILLYWHIDILSAQRGALREGAPSKGIVTSGYLAQKIRWCARALFEAHVCRFYHGLSGDCVYQCDKNRYWHARFCWWIMYTSMYAHFHVFKDMYTHVCVCVYKKIHMCIHTLYRPWLSWANVVLKENNVMIYTHASLTYLRLQIVTIFCIRDLYFNQFYFPKPPNVYVSVCTQIYIHTC